MFTPRAIDVARGDGARARCTSGSRSSDPASFDVVADFSALFPNEVITTMLGVPKADRHQIRLWLDSASGSDHPGEIATTRRRAYEGVGADTGVYYYNLIQQRRAEPQDDMISRLIETEIERDGRSGEADRRRHRGVRDACSAARALTRPSRSLVGNAIVAFADFPDEWQKLRGDRSKIPGRGRGTVALRGAHFRSTRCAPPRAT